MADENQLEILKQGVEAWNSWRKDHPGVKIELSEAALVGAHLQLSNLKKADLREANLTEADLKRAVLTRVDLKRAVLVEADLRGVDLWEADLRKADLRDANLEGADLRRANLREACLEGANLSDASLRDANLTGAEMTRVDLMGANLTRADFYGSNLTGARLTRANLTGANLLKTDFTDADFGFTIIGDNDLSASIGLASIYHGGPSILGGNTIRYFKGKISIKFLRGCGLSDLEIESAKLAAPGLDPEQVTQITYEIYRLYCDRPIQFYSCFISYNSKDQKFAQRLHDDLQNNGVRCWFAPEDLKIGDEFRRTIGQQIRVRDKLLILLSKNSVGSEWVGDEVEKALSEEKEQHTLKLFPIRLDSAVLKAKDDWAEKIRLRRHIGDFSAWKDEDKYRNAFERLLNDLKTQ
jgi:uncharacterized protein YjbI with pentapeptide repeats